MKNYDLYATMGTGFEAVVAKELQNLGYNTTTENGRVFFKGDIEDIIKTNINLRTADRIKILLKEFKALDFETLYDQIFNYDWAQLLPVDAKFLFLDAVSKVNYIQNPTFSLLSKKL